MMVRLPQIKLYLPSSTFHINDHEGAKKNWNHKEKTKKCCSLAAVVVDVQDGIWSRKDSFALKFVRDYNGRTIGSEFGIQSQLQ